MTYDGSNGITYDYTNKPVRFENAEYIVHVRYDAVERRVSKESVRKASGGGNGGGDSDATEFEGYVLDGWRVVSDIDANGGVTKSYIWGNGIDELLATAKGNSSKYAYYLNNHLGSITYIVNNKGEVQESYKYKAYGEPSIFDRRGDTIPQSREKNRYMFTGREYESETGLYYSRVRFFLSFFLVRNVGKFQYNTIIYCAGYSNLSYIYTVKFPICGNIKISGKRLQLKRHSRNRTFLICVDKM